MGGVVFPPFFENQGTFLRLVFPMINIELNVFFIFEISIKTQFSLYINLYKISFCKVLVIIGPSRSLLIICYHKMFVAWKQCLEIKKKGFKKGMNSEPSLPYIWHQYLTKNARKTSIVKPTLKPTLKESCKSTFMASKEFNEGK